MQQHINVICVNEPSSNEWANLICKLRRGEQLFPGIIGYDDTVVPQIVNAILSRHNFILLGLRALYPQTNGARSRQDRSALTRAKASKARAFSGMTGGRRPFSFIRGDDLDVVLLAR